MIHRQKQRSFKQAIGARQLLREPKISEAMDRDAIPLDDGPDRAIGKMGSKSIAVLAANLVILKDVEVPLPGIGCRRKLDRQIAEGLVKSSGDFPTPLDGFIVPAELVAEDRRLDVVDPRVRSPNCAIGSDSLVSTSPVVAHRTHCRGKLVIIGDERTGVAQAAQCLGRIEAKSAPASEPARSRSVELGAERLRRILVDFELMLVSDLAK